MSLYLVSTPIGNLRDVSERAKDVLGKVSAVLAEDTRRTGILMRHVGLSRPLTRYDDHTHRRLAPGLVDRLAAGEDLALVSDAGTPGLSDPGARLAAAAVDRGVNVVPVPGPSAVLAALAGSGLPWDQFTFLGFLSRRPGQRRRELEQVGRDRTVVFYESPYRVVAALESVHEAWGDVPVAVARELTKAHEEFVRGPVRGVLEVLKGRKDILGEITVVVAPQAARGEPADRPREVG